MFRSAIHACRPSVAAPLVVSALLLSLVLGAYAAKGDGGAPSAPTGDVALELRRDISVDGWRAGAAYVLAALPRQAAASARAARSTDRRAVMLGS